MRTVILVSALLISGAIWGEIISHYSVSAEYIICIILVTAMFMDITDFSRNKKG